MSLEEQIKKEEEEMKRLEEGGEPDAREEETIEEDVSEDEGVDDDVEEDSDEGEEKDDGDKDAVKEDESAEDEGDKEEAKDEAEDASLAAQLRIARKQNKQLQEHQRLMQEQLAQLQQNNNPAQQNQNQAQPSQPEQKELTVEEQLAQMQQEKQYSNLLNQATQELAAIEDDFVQEVPDYNKATEHMQASMEDAVLKANPGATRLQAKQYVNQQVFKMACQYSGMGVNPAEALYNIAMERYGYKPEVQNQDVTKENLDKQAQNLRKIQKNKRRSASSLQGGGQNSSTSVTSEEAAALTMADFAKLSEAEINQLILESS